MNEHEFENEMAIFDSLIGGLAEYAVNPGIDSKQFFGKTTQVVETILDSDWMAVVALGPDDSTLLIHDSGEAKTGLSSLATSVGERGKIRFSSLLQSQSQNSKNGLVIRPIKRAANQDTESSTWGALFVHLKGQTSTSVEAGVVDAIGESIEAFVVRQSQEKSADADQFQDEFLRFSVNAHSSLDQREVAHHLANDSRLLLGCERVSIFQINGRKPKLLAVSSVATVEGRSELVRNLNAMVGWAVRSGVPIMSDHVSNDERQSDLLRSHCEETNLPFVFGIPIHQNDGGVEPSNGKPIGFLLAESNEDIDRVKFARAISHVEPHVASSLSNSNVYSQIPFRRTLGGLGRIFNVANLSHAAIAIGLVALMTLAALFLKTDFKIRITGELRPAVERNVFASYDGVVEDVFVTHGDSVSTTDSLLKIRSPELELEIEKASSDIGKLKQLKEAKQIALNQVSSADADPGLAAQLASEMSDLEFQMATLMEKQRFLNEQKNELQILSPIDGQVTTWQLKERLTDKPVRWGDPVLNVAQLDGDWVIVFRVPEGRVGYLLARQKELGDEPLVLDFFLDSNPGTKFRIPIESIDHSVIQDEELGPVTMLRCSAPPDLLTKRQGASISADVDCGRESYFSVWTREMFDSLRRRFVW